MNSDKIDRKNSIGVAFSGGGLQGIAHIGAVQALYELGIHPQYVSGTSSGAAMAAIVAMGCESIGKLLPKSTTALFSNLLHSLF